MLIIALPVIGTMVSFTLMQFVDKLYCGMLGAEALAAAGNGGLAAFFPVSVMMGLLGVVNTYVSQHLGAGRPERGPAYAWNAMWMSLIVWIAVLLPYALFLPQVFSFMRSTMGVDQPSAWVIEHETIYARVLLFGMVLTVCARSLAQYFYGMHRPMTVAIGTLVANLVNWFFTWALVFGKMGLPQWGVAGSAVATVIGSLIELAVPMAVFLSARYHHAYATRAAWRPSLTHMKEIWKIGWPAGVMFGNEMVCWWIFMSGLVAQYGDEHNAAGWIALTYMHLSFMPAVGLSFAMTAIVGKCIGAGRHDLVPARVWLGIRLAMVYMGLCALCFVIFRGPMIDLFIAPTESPEVAAKILAIGSRLLILAAIFQLFDAVGITLVGSLRGAGDTVWPGLMTVVLAWGVIIVGGKLATVLWPGLESLGPWIAAATYIILFAIGLAYRFMSGAWLRIKVVNGEQPPTTPASPGCGIELSALATTTPSPACAAEAATLDPLDPPPEPNPSATA